MNDWNTMLGNIAQVQSQAQTSSTITLGPTGATGSASPITWGTNTTSIPGNLTWGPGSSGQVYTTNGTGNLSWATLASDPSLKGNSLSVKGDADFEGEVKIKGKSLTDMFEKIEERLAILHPNPELEDKWDELKELGKRYKELEAEIIEKEKMWAILKR
jgi:hypothetical protein